MELTNQQHDALIRLLQNLIDQENCRTIVEPYARESGFWFGGGNIVADDDGTLWLCGRYRNFGDSRTGVKAGTRGLECAIFRSTNNGETFEKQLSFSKQDLSFDDKEVLSIEGVSLHRNSDGKWDLYVSTEKAIDYPEEFASFQKPGTGVWSIDVLRGESPASLDATTITPVLFSKNPETLHVKDPAVIDLRRDIAHGGLQTGMIFCSHPFSWSSTNSHIVNVLKDSEAVEFNSPPIVARGPVWDVAVTRITARMAIPNLGLFENASDHSIFFYDGAESLRKMDENANAHSRPRGYSCEELGGAMVCKDMFLAANLNRLSDIEPMFVSPYGTGCSRYVDVLLHNGDLIATWQQAQKDGSQPLVMHRLPASEVEKLLS